jgi:hypothetical protein
MYYQTQPQPPAQQSELVISRKIKEIFEQNQLKDLHKFLEKRENLNAWNAYLAYLFHILQSAGILVTSISASLNSQNMLWAGVTLNMLAGLVQIYEKINDGQLKRLYKDILAIKNGTYVDESILVDLSESSANMTGSGAANTTGAVDSPPPQPPKINGYNTFTDTLSVPQMFSQQQQQHQQQQQQQQHQQQQQMDLEKGLADSNDSTHPLLS